MRVLMITDYYWPYVGGVEQHVRHLSRELAARNHEVAVATLGNDKLAPMEYDGDVRIYRIRTSMQRMKGIFTNSERTWAPPFPDPKASKQLSKIIETEKPQILHGHDWLARSALPYKKKSGAKFIMSLHYYTISCAKKNLMYRDAPCTGPRPIKCLRCATDHYGMGKGAPVTLTNSLMGVFEKACVDYFLPVSQATALGNGLTDETKYKVIPNFLADDLDISPDVQNYLEQLPKEPFLMFVGDLRRQKGFHNLLLAYSELSDAPPLVAIGKVCTDTPEVFPKNVNVLMNWPNEAVLAAWRQSLMALVPSIWPEPFGLVIIEAMLNGRPVIASNIGGIPEIVRNGSTGLLVPPDNVKALKDAIVRLLDDSDLRDRMGKEAKLQAAAYQSAAVVPRIEDVYSKLINGSL